MFGRHAAPLSVGARLLRGMVRSSNKQKSLIEAYSWAYYWWVLVNSNDVAFIPKSSAPD